jgi:exopolysaccharide biosynthesis WecB/TagA/CpsF family protein
MLGGLPIAVVDRAESARSLVETALSRRGSGAKPVYVTSANGQVMALCARDRAMRDLFLDADVIHADGMPMVYASRYKCRAALPERVATTDWLHDVAAIAAERGASFYILGAAEAVNREAVRRLRAAYPALQIVGRRDGFIKPEDEAAVVADIAARKPDFLWVSMGVPREQAFVSRNIDKLRGVGVIKTAGGLLDFVAGAKRRAPDWMQRAGLEWLYRTWLEPSRLGWRYLTTNPYALYLLLTRSS